MIMSNCSFGAAKKTCMFAHVYFDMVGIMNYLPLMHICIAGLSNWFDLSSEQFYMIAELLTTIRYVHVPDRDRSSDIH